MGIKAIIFDFDGVLVESVAVKLDAYAALFENEGADTSRRVREFCEPRMGLSRFRLIDEICREVLQIGLSPEKRGQLCDRFAALVVGGVVAAPFVAGAQEFLSRFADRYRLFIVSGTPQNELEEILRRRQMTRWFEASFGSPAPKDALLADLLTSHRLRPEDVVYVGDSDHDWTAVRSQGIRFIWRRSSPGHVRPAGFDGPTIENLSDLPSCLDRMGAAEKGPSGVTS